MKNGWVVCWSLVQKDFFQTGTPLDAVPVPGASFQRSLRATHSSSHSSPLCNNPSPHWIIYSIYFINYIWLFISFFKIFLIIILQFITLIILGWKKYISDHHSDIKILQPFSMILHFEVFEFYFLLKIN